MSVYRPTADSTTYVYDFHWRGQRYKDTTYQTTKAAALLVEAKKKLDLREQAGGLVPRTPLETPTFSAWADVTLAYQTKFIRRPEILARTLDMVLAFWGQAPTRPIQAPAVPRPEATRRPYHDRRLGDPISDPTWLERFETWMTARRLSGSTRNSYLSACSNLYTCALQPQYRATTGITTNPFAGIRRSPTRSRVIALTPDQILALVGTAARHIAHALCIAALAPKLRVESILGLEWAGHLDPDLRTITITDHKTQQRTKHAQTVPVSGQLRAILQDIRTAQAREAERRGKTPSRYVITPYGKHNGERIHSIKRGLRRAVEAVGLAWGLKDGVTFHVMRHSIATILANADLVGPLTERLRADVMGHLEIRTTQQYTHLNPAVQAGPHESLSAALPGLRRALGGRPSVGGKLGGPPSPKGPKPQQKRVLPFAGSPKSNGQKSAISLRKTAKTWI